MFDNDDVTTESRPTRRFTTYGKDATEARARFLSVQAAATERYEATTGQRDLDPITGDRILSFVQDFEAPVIGGWIEYIVTVGDAPKDCEGGDV